MYIYIYMYIYNINIYIYIYIYQYIYIYIYPPQHSGGPRERVQTAARRRPGQMHSPMLRMSTVSFGIYDSDFRFVAHGPAFQVLGFGMGMGVLRSSSGIGM